jgi:hypothetical protein
MNAATKKFLFDTDFAGTGESKSTGTAIALTEHVLKVAEAETAAHRRGYADAQSDAAIETGPREPFAEISALASDCFRQLVSAPHIAVRVNDALYAIAKERLEEIVRARSFEGRLVVLAEPDIAIGDCRIEWADGGINRDSAATEAAIAAAVDGYIGARRNVAASHDTLRRSEHE